MIISIIVFLIYFTFILDFFVWPIPSEVSTRAVLASSDQKPGKHGLLIVSQVIVLATWALPLLYASYELLSVAAVTSHGLAISGLGLAVCGRLFTILASISLRSYRMKDSQEDALNDQSVFALSRHPIVVGLHLTLAGLLLTVQWWLLLLPYILTLVYFHKKLCQEEAFLNTRFPTSYPAYCQRTPRYLLWV